MGATTGAGFFADAATDGGSSMLSSTSINDVSAGKSILVVVSKGWSWMWRTYDLGTAVSVAGAVGAGVGSAGAEVVVVVVFVARFDNFPLT